MLAYGLPLLFPNFRLYTGIHAMKPKPKLKGGAISESTTALNVDQSKSSAFVDKKSAVSSIPLQQPSPLAPSSKAGNSLELALPSSTTETANCGSAAAPLAQKKEAGLAKVHADKKKMDARKKSLKRL